MCIEWNDDWLIKDIYEHQNSNSMNEYKGFKVGDRVEVIDPCSSSKNKKGDIGIIKEMQSGSLMEYGKCVVILVVPEGASDVARWEHFSAIKKLPKYAVGDVVRRMGVISVVVKYEETPPYYLVDGADGKDSNWSLMSELTDFDGFRIGDTVFTVKRGKGKIVADRESMPRRFKVVFDADKDHPTIICRHPKLTNLIPTESLYKEALMKNIFTSKPDDNPVIAACHKAFTAAQIAESLKRFAKIAYKFPSGGVVSDAPKYKFYKDRLPICPFTEKLVWMDKEPTYFGQVQVAPSPKFKVGDAVYHKGNKLFVKRNMISCPQMVEVGNSCAGYTTVVAESDLRLWKETVLTHCLQTLSNTWHPTSCVSKYEKIIHLGGFRIDGETRDMFACYGKNGKLLLWAGIKGDDTTESI